MMIKSSSDTLASLGLTIQPAASALNRVKELFDLASDEEDELG